MAEIMLPVDPLQNMRRIADRGTDIQRSDHTASKLVSDVSVDPWMLPVCYPILYVAMAANLARIGTETVAAFTSAIGMHDAEDGRAGISPCSSKTLENVSVEEGMASDRRRIECDTLEGWLMEDLSLPFRTDVILAASVIC